MINDVSAARAISAKPLPTRWKPVDLACGDPEAELVVRTKLIRCRDSAAVCIAEAISYHVFDRLGVRVPDSHAVVVGPSFADELTKQYDFDPPVHEGRHWGTTYLHDVQEVEFDISHVPYLRTPTDMFRLFLGDLLLANPDRFTHGNLLLGQSAGSDHLDIIAIDHSDCFNHPSCMLDPDRLRRAAAERIARWPPGTEGVVLGKPRDFSRESITAVKSLLPTLCDAPQHVPEEWYDKAGVDPATLVDFLRSRIENLEALAQLDYWEGLSDAIGGGHVLTL